MLHHPSLKAKLEEGPPTRHAESVAATIALSYARLDAATATDARALTLLRRAAQLAPAPIPHRLLIRLADGDPDDEEQAVEVDGVLRRLAALGLIELLPDGAAALHRLIAAFVREQDLDAPGTQAEGAARLNRMVSAINTAGYPLRGTPYLAHLSQLVQRQNHLADAQRATLAANLGDLLRAQGDLAGARPYYERALAMREQVLGRPTPTRAQMLGLGPKGQPRDK